MDKWIAFAAGVVSAILGGIVTKMDIAPTVLFLISCGSCIFLTWRLYHAEHERNFHYWKAADALRRSSMNAGLLSEVQRRGLVSPEANAFIEKQCRVDETALADWAIKNPMPRIPDNEGPYV